MFVIHKLLDDEVRLAVPEATRWPRQKTRPGRLAEESWIAGCPRCRGHLLQLYPQGRVPPQRVVRDRGLRRGPGPGRRGPGRRADPRPDPAQAPPPRRRHAADHAGLPPAIMWSPPATCSGCRRSRPRSTPSCEAPRRSRRRPRCAVQEPAFSRSEVRVTAGAGARRPRVEDLALDELGLGPRAVPGESRPWGGALGATTAPASVATAVAVAELPPERRIRRSPFSQEVTGAPSWCASLSVVGV